MSSVYPSFSPFVDLTVLNTTCTEGKNEVGGASKPVVAIPLPLGMTVLKSCGCGSALSVAITTAAHNATKSL
jgi:hypothetical protein